MNCRSIFTTVAFLAHLPALSFAAGLQAHAASADLPVLFTVGGDGSCSHTTLQSALDAAAANGSDNDVIRIATNHADTAISAKIIAQSVTLEGGYSTCAASSPSGRTTLDGSGGSVDSVIDVSGGSLASQHVVLLRDLVVRGGENDGNGGGIEISGGMNVRLESTVVENNLSTFGGGISIQGSAGASLVIAEFSQILSNEAIQKGGGVYCESGFVGLFDSAIAVNQSDRGGGIALDGCLFRDQAGGVLLGIYLNSATSQGGGIYGRGNSTIELTGSATAPAAVTSNSTEGTGGGIWAGESVVRAKNATIDNNTAHTGGGIGLGINGHLFMERLPGQACHTTDRCSTLSNNFATTRGGALYVNSASGVAEVRQTFIEDNSATLEGSVAYVTVFGRLVMESVVIAGNQGGESVIKLRGDTSGLLAFISMTDNSASDALIVGRDSTFGPAAGLELYSSVIWETSGTDILSFDAGTPVEVDCLLVHETATLPAGAYITISNPQFVDAPAGDYHLTLASPAVDYCDAAAYQPTHRDIDQQERGQDHPLVPDNFLISWYDIGADAHPLSGLIFSDGFESGDVSAWSASVP